MQLGHESEVKAGGRTTSSHLWWKSHGDAALLGVVSMTSESSLFEKAFSRCVKFLGSLEDLLACWTGTYLNFKLWRERRLIIATCQTKATTWMHIDCVVLCLRSCRKIFGPPLPGGFKEAVFFLPLSVEALGWRRTLRNSQICRSAPSKCQCIDFDHGSFPHGCPCMPARHCSQDRGGGVLQEGLSAPWILFTSSGTLQTSGVQRPVTSMV